MKREPTVAPRLFAATILIAEASVGLMLVLVEICGSRGG
jgi:hypothetical protein